LAAFLAAGFFTAFLAAGFFAAAFFAAGFLAAFLAVAMVIPPGCIDKTAVEINDTAEQHCQEPQNRRWWAEGEKVEPALPARTRFCVSCHSENMRYIE
jgi:hypothetical protein